MKSKKACDVCGYGCRPTGKKWKWIKKVAPILGMILLVFGMLNCAPEEPDQTACEIENEQLKNETRDVWHRLWEAQDSCGCYDQG